MILIFDDLLKDFQDFKLKFCEKIKNKFMYKFIPFCIIAVLAIIITIISTGITFGYTVSYDGTNIGIVKHADVFDKAVNIAKSNVNGDNVDINIKDPKFNLTLTVSDRMTTATKIADIIIDKTSDIVVASALVVNGKEVTKIENFDVQNYLDQHLSKYDMEGATNFSAYEDKIEVRTGYYIASQVDDLHDFLLKADNLQIITYSTVQSDIEVPFSCVTQKTDTQLLGYSAIIVNGENGINRKTEKVVLKNGVEQSRTELSTNTVKQPVDEVTVVGTAKSVASATQRLAAANAGFIFPLPRGTWRVTAYYGDGRSHKGVDLSADKGTSIFAVKSGKVEYSGYDGNYGYCIVIDHGNGLKTRYAHASKLLVSTGDNVSAGQVIAQIGATGYATGNHLHFEVLINNSNVDPAPYLGVG